MRPPVCDYGDKFMYVLKSSSMAPTYLQCGGDNFIWKCEVCAEIFDALVGEVVVIVLPVEGLSAEAL